MNINPLQTHIHSCIMGAYLLLSDACKKLRSAEGEEIPGAERMLKSAHDALQTLRDASHIVVRLQDEGEEWASKYLNYHKGEDNEKN